MYQLEPFKLTPIPASKHEPVYVLGVNPRNARVMAFSQVGSDVYYASKYRCARVKNIKELPADIKKQFQKHQRQWDKHVAKLKKAAVLAIYAVVDGITEEQAEAVVREIAFGQVPYIKFHVAGALRR